MKEREKSRRMKKHDAFLASGVSVRCVNKWVAEMWQTLPYLGMQTACLLALITPKSNDVSAPLLSRRLDIWIIVRLTQPPSLPVCVLVGLLCNKKCLRSVHSSSDSLLWLDQSHLNHDHNQGHLWQRDLLKHRLDWSHRRCSDSFSDILSK